MNEDFGFICGFIFFIIFFNMTSSSLNSTSTFSTRISVLTHISPLAFSLSIPAHRALLKELHHFTTIGSTFSYCNVLSSVSLNYRDQFKFQCPPWKGVMPVREFVSAAGSACTICIFGNFGIAITIMISLCNSHRFGDSDDSEEPENGDFASLRYLPTRLVYQLKPQAQANCTGKLHHLAECQAAESLPLNLEKTEKAPHHGAGPQHSSPQLPAPAPAFNIQRVTQGTAVPQAILKNIFVCRNPRPTLSI
ncbi:hypothetical protein AALO_G00301280 [Alosa alosa]|uniref:Uncharacterized protein n=1 Tax=Alosa alosa TaxID=278164 RepID=A0AAV6FHC3_9TELE|nr:hypothetical protein AALO_G00301280 [Alosa alosa]